MTEITLSHSKSKPSQPTMSFKDLWIGAYLAKDSEDKLNVVFINYQGKNTSDRYALLCKQGNFGKSVEWTHADLDYMDKNFQLVNDQEVEFRILFNKGMT